MKAETRSCGVECRADETRESPGVLTGTLLTYGERARDRAEIFLPGALTWPEDGVVLRRQHNAKAPIARVRPEERDGSVVLDCRLPDTVAGRDAAAEIRSGLFTGLSVEFRATSQTYRGAVRVIQKADLLGVGLVDKPAYKASRVEVRAKRRRVWL